MATCPNKSHPDWIALVKEVGEERAYFHYYNNNYQIPESLPEAIELDAEDKAYTHSVMQYETEDNNNLNEAVTNFLKGIGVDVKVVTELVNREGNVVDGVALSDLLYKTIQVVEGKLGVDTLPEEASHFLVGILKSSGNPLYTSMFNDIQKFTIYKEVVDEYGALYGNNVTKLKDEAIAKVITQAMLGQIEDVKLEQRAKTWWNRVIDYIKSLFAKGNRTELESSILSYAPFKESANMIVENRIAEDYHKYQLEEVVDEGEFFQLRNQEQKTIVDALRNNLGRGTILMDRDTEKRELHLPDGTVKPIKNRVTDRVANYMKKLNFVDRTPLEVIGDKIRAEVGTLGHDDIQNIINRAVAKKQRTVVPSKSANLTDSQYDLLESFFNDFLNQFPEGTEFLTEQVVYDEKADESGSIDLLAVLPTGQVDIYDWKFVEFRGKNGKIPHFKVQGWNIQLGRYADILAKTYGIKNIGKKRVIPFETKYKDNKLTGIAVGATEIKNFNKKNEHLRPVPIFSEMTNDDGLNKLIEELVNKKEALNDSKPEVGSSDAQKTAFYQNRLIKLKEIDDTIRSIQLTHDIKDYIKFGIRQIKDIEAKGISNLTQKELNDSYKNLKFYSNEIINTVGHLLQGRTKEFTEELGGLVLNAQEYTRRIENENIRRTSTNYGNDILTPQKGGNWWIREVRALSQQDHPILRAFFDLIKSSKTKTRDEVGAVQEKISTSIRKLTEYYQKQGVASDRIFDELLQETDDDYQITAKYSTEFYKEQDKQRNKLKNGTKAEQQEALNWFEDNTVFDQEKYDAALKAVTIQYKATFKHYDNAKEAYDKAIKQFRNKNERGTDGYQNKANYYLKPTSAHYSDKFKHIQSVPELKEFYDLWTEETTKYQRIIGQPVNARFIWNVKKDFIDSLAENGLSAFGDLSFVNEIEGNVEARVGNVDPQTGEPIHSLPIYYTQPIYKTDKDGKLIKDKARKSRDLGRVLLLASHMTYNYKHMAEIEDSSKALETVLANNEEILTNNNGETITNPVTQRVQKILGSSNTLEQMHDYMNYYLYGIKLKTKDYRINVAGKSISGIGLYSAIAKTYVGKALAGNPISIVANATAGSWNVRMVGMGGKWFSNSQYSKGLTELATANKKAYSIAGYFDLVDGENFWKKATDMSVNKLTKYVNYENLFIGQKAGDYGIRNSVLLGMLRAHTFQDGKIRKIKEGEEAKSLYDSMEIVDDKLNLGEIPKDALDGFRNKVLYVTDNILGNNSRDDIRKLQMTLMGRALFMFRSWMPRTIDARYGEFRYNGDIDEFEIGRYRSFWGQVVNKQFLPLMLDTIKGFGVPLLGYGGKFSNTTIEHAKGLFREHVLNNPGLIKDEEYAMREQEFIDLHLANLRSNMMELYVVGTVLTLLMAVKPNPDEPDEEWAGIRKYVVRQLDRNLSEILFYYNVTEFNRMVKSPIPILGAFTDIINLFTHTGKQAVGAITQDEKMMYNARPMKYSFKLFPVLNGIESAIAIMDEDYDREKSATTSSRSR